MKKKYSTLLNFALVACVATTLVACSDGDNSTSVTGSAIETGQAVVSIGGNVIDTNGNPLEDVTVSCQGEQATTNSSGQYVIHDLQVINVAGGREGTTNSEDEFDHPVQCIVEAPAGYLGGQVWVYPEAQVLNNLYDNTSEENTQTNQPLLWIDNMFAQAATMALPKLDSEVCGVLRMCSTGEPVTDAQLRLDMWAVNNNTSDEQANSNGWTSNIGYSNGLYQTTTDAEDGTFCISNVPDDSILRLYAPMYQELSVDGNGAASVDPNYGNCSGTTPCTAEGDYITTVNEGLLTLGNVCVNTIAASDSLKPCVAGLSGMIYPLGFQPGGTIPVVTPWFDDTLEFALLEDDIDGTGGIDFTFTESLQPGAIDENSIVIWDATEESYITDFSVAFSGNTLTITTAAAIPSDDYILVYLLRDDFRDLAGNYLTAEDIVDAPPVCADVYFAEEWYSNNDTAYVVVGFKIHSPDNTNVGAATDLAQVCLDEGGNAGLADLNAAYPNVFTDQGSSGTTGLFQNLNSDGDYESRLEALADVIGGSDSELANVSNGYATVTFTEADAGTFEVDANSTTFCTGSNAGGSESCTVSGVSVGDTVMITSLDDFDNPSNVASIDLVDCVAPTTVLNYAYNTCGHIGYDPGVLGYADATAYDTDYAAHLCADFEAGSVDEFGDGGENSGEGIAGLLGIPTLNITCRLLKDASDAPGVNPPISFFGLYDGTSTPGVNGDTAGFAGGPAQLYDATEWAAWGMFTDTIGVAFSESIAMTAAGTIDWNGVTNIDSWAIGNNIGTTDNGDNPDGGANAGTVDLVQITVDDVLSLANVDHLEIMDFSNAVEDTAGNAAENARVVVNDLLPPLVVWSYWDGDLVIQFNEAVDVCLDAAACTPDFVTLRDPMYGANGPIADVSLTTDGATLSVDGTMLTIPAATIAATLFDRDDQFPGVGVDPDALVYAEPVYDTLVLNPLPTYNHGRLNWDDIKDANNGNRWEDWDGDAPGVNTDSYAEPKDTEGNWRYDFVDLAGDFQCQTPEFATIDALGDFIITSFPLTFGAGDDPSTYSIVYQFSQPIEYAPFGACVTGDDACVNAWLAVVANVDGVTAYPVGPIEGTDVGADITSNYNSATQTLTLNYISPVPSPGVAYTWVLNDAITLDSVPTFRFQSVFGGSLRSLNNHFIQ